ncbi:hypothetical protein ABPG72_004716 [Tetrahymena utriculariae]
MENIEEISVLIEELNDDYENNIDFNQIKPKITYINGLLSQLEFDNYEKYEFLKYQLSVICVPIFERQNDQRSVSQFQKLINQHREGYQKYINAQFSINDSFSTQPYSNNIQSTISNQNSLNQTENFFINTQVSRMDGDSNIILQNIYIAQEVDQIINNSLNQDQIEQNEDQQGIKALVKLKKKQAETHYLGIFVNGACRVGIKGVTAALNIAKSLSLWSSLVVATGVAAAEAVFIIKNYKKSKKQCQNNEQRQMAKKFLIQQLKALGVKSFTTLGITTGCIIGGSIVGSCIPGIGTLLGSLLGAIIGTILSYVADEQLQNLIFDEKKLLQECERDLGISNWEIVNKKKYNKQDVERMFRRKMLSLHPDKHSNYPEIQNVQKYELQKVQFAKEYIQQLYQWS